MLLPIWTAIEMDDALELLGPGFVDGRVRGYAVKQLARAEDDVRASHVLNKSRRPEETRAARAHFPPYCPSLALLSSVDPGAPPVPSPARPSPSIRQHRTSFRLPLYTLVPLRFQHRQCSARHTIYRRLGPGRLAHRTKRGESAAGEQVLLVSHRRVRGSNGREDVRQDRVPLYDGDDEGMLSVSCPSLLN